MLHPIKMTQDLASVLKLLEASESKVYQLQETNRLLQSDKETERIRFEDSLTRNDILLNKNIQRLAKMNSELESFAYISSHDLQEPLRKIRTFAGRIAESDHEHLSETGKDYFSRINKAVERMQVLIDDLLAYSRAANRAQAIENTDLNILMEEVFTELKEDIQMTKAVIDITDLCEARIVPFQFRQLMINLLCNALKFTYPGRPPVIKITSGIVESASLPAEPVSGYSTYCHIAVADNGIGFEQEYAEQIFELFQRLHGREEFTGTGIGLAIVKKIVDNHEGIITAHSQPGKGTRFDIYIPHL